MANSTRPDLAAIKARLDAATPGPWEWYGNTKTNEVYLATTHSGRRFVMDFVRWGMSGAQPRFQVLINGHEEGGGVMRSLSQLTTGDANARERNEDLPVLGAKYEASHRKQFTGIGHADAAFLAHARQDVEQLVARVEELESALAKERELTEARKIVARAARQIVRDEHTSELQRESARVNEMGGVIAHLVGVLAEVHRATNIENVRTFAEIALTNIESWHAGAWAPGPSDDAADWKPGHWRKEAGL